ncbi:MAG: hypothetical protein H6Q14_1576 [Bacteroidetes bacterium]|nr:hypothetical protein [Bacteroidota bacterium]
MAESKNNVITHGLSGKVGDLIVFRNVNGKTIVANKPKERTGELSDEQKTHKKKFQQAIIYAKSAIADPDTAEAYKKAAPKGKSAYNLAVADFFHAPDISEVNLEKYTGKIGDTIAVTVTDDFSVQEVSVTIQNGDGTLVEQGLAQKAPGSVQWIYTASAENSSLDGDKIIIKASDLPGHATEQEEAL